MPKINVFEENSFWLIRFIKLKCRRLRNGLDIWKSIEQPLENLLTVDALHSLKKNHIFRDFWKSSVARVWIVVCVLFYLSMVDKYLTELGQSILGRQIFDTAAHFRFQCETLTTNLASFVNDVFSF